MTRFGHLAYIQSLIRLALSLALIGTISASEVLAADFGNRMNAAIRVGMTGRKVNRENRAGLALGFSADTKIASNWLGGMNFDYLALNAGRSSSRLFSGTYVIRADIGNREGLFHVRPGAGLGVGLEEQSGASSIGGCLRLSVDFAWINPNKATNWLADCGFSAWGGNDYSASPLVFVRLGLLIR